MSDHGMRDDDGLLRGAGHGGSAPARRSIRGRRILIGLLGAGVLALLLLSVPLRIHPLDRWVRGVSGHGRDSSAATGQTAQRQLWTCGMHPEVIQDHPGDCPICGMKLTPLRANTSGGGEETDVGEGTTEMVPGAAAMKTGAGEMQGGTGGMRAGAGGMDAGAMQGDSASAATASGHGRRKILFYRNPMDPTVTSPVPAKDDMGMDYVPVYADEAVSAAAQGATVTIDPVTVQNMNVTTEPVERRDVRRSIRTVGYLDYDQDKMVSVTTKYSGFVEKAYVNYIGQPVRRGQPLLEIYSPELLQTEQELLSARQYVDKMKSAPPQAQDRARALLDAARARLSYWDIAPEQVKKLEDSGQIFRTLTLVAPAGGVVMKRMDSLEGMAVKPGMELLHIADLSTLWLAVDVYEAQLPWVDTGSDAQVKLTYFPGATFTGRVRYVEPEVSDKTRSVKLTLELPNRDGRLRAGMYATVEFSPVVVKNAITVPSQAVLRTGERDLVVVALGGGRFAPREVQLGAEGDGFVQVLSGLDDGSRIVTSSEFLIDSESNLRAAIQKMIAAAQK
jgi:RND family efflux transporter MFP subunit